MSIVTLKEGDKAPNFSGKDQNGKTISLSDLKGKRVIMFFYPKDMTPGCTAEACNLGERPSMSAGPTSVFSATARAVSTVWS